MWHDTSIRWSPNTVGMSLIIQALNNFISIQFRVSHGIRFLTNDRMGGFYQVPDTWRSAVVLLVYRTVKYCPACCHNPKWRKVVLGPKLRSYSGKGTRWEGERHLYAVLSPGNKMLFGVYPSSPTGRHLHLWSTAVTPAHAPCAVGNSQDLISNQGVSQIWGKQLHCNNAV